MKRILVGLSLLVTVCQPACALEWLTDLPTALTRAKKENKAVLLDFTGSDWCGWCMKLKKEVFDTFDFALYANANLVMVEVDFPRHKGQTLELIKANSNLAAKYGIEGYPTIILLNSDGQQIGQTGYVEGGTRAFIAEINRFPGMPHNGSPGTPAPAVAAGKTPPPAPGQPPAPAPPTRYGELTLKGISGSGNRRMALINNETIMAGESARVKTMDTSVDVLVKEIRDDSVTIVVNGKSRELKLAHH
jgi:thioredoxin-related protein